MFLSSDFLAINYGVDDGIARFFVDREPPADNLYWKDKLLYLRIAPGYIFIPLIVDILNKIGLPKVALLSGEFVELMEKVGHISALEETGQIEQTQALEACKALVKNNCLNNGWLKIVNEYFDQIPGNLIGSLAGPFPALHRGDLFLYSLCAIPFEENLQKAIIEHWFALIGILLLLDDSEDVKSDLEKNEENAFLQSALIPGGNRALRQLIMDYVVKLGKINRPMAGRLDERCKLLLENPQIQPYIK